MNNILQSVLNLYASGSVTNDLNLSEYQNNLIVTVEIDGTQKTVINYMIAIPYLIGSIQELSTQLDSALTRIAALEGSP